MLAETTQLIKKLKHGYLGSKPFPRIGFPDTENKPVSYFHFAVTRYMARSFKPCRITAPIHEWKNLAYNNPLFNVTIIEDTLKVKFVTDKNHNHIDQPSNELSNILSAPTFSIEFNLKPSETNDYLTLDTKGELEIRKILMLKDFVFKNATIDMKSDVSYIQTINGWHRTINECPLDILKNILVKYMNRPFFDVEVIKSPIYSPKDFKDLKSEDSFLNELENCIWYTEDCNLSWPAAIFFANSKNLLSIGNVPPEFKYPILYDTIQEKSQTYTSPLMKLFNDIFSKKTQIEPSSHTNHFTAGYYSLARAEGGITMPYVSLMPFSLLKQSIGSDLTMAFLPNYELKTAGNKYSPDYDITAEELVIFAEALKHAGAEIEYHY